MSSTTIVVPELSESVSEARVGRWLKEEGERVSAGEALVELETDKVDLEVGAETSGVLSRILHPEGDEVQAGDELAVIEPTSDDSEDVEDSRGRDDSDQAHEPKEESEAESGAKSDERTTVSKEKDRTREGREEEAPTDREPEHDEADKPASPSARRLAREKGVSLAEIGEKTDQDRIGREDVERFLERARRDDRARETREPLAKEESGDGRREELVRMSGRRRTIARRLVEAQRNAAMLTTFNEIDMGAVMELRHRQKDVFAERHGVRLGIVSFFVRACIGALREFPRLNAEVRGDGMLLKHYYDIGIAVGDPEGLVVPVLRDADRLSLAQIERRIKDFAAKAEDGRFTPDELTGGTFTITNGGVFGSLLSTPILNPPQVGILGLHKIEDRPFAVDGRIQVRPLMYVALSYDHRIVDGLEAVQFLVRIKELIESPDRLLLEG